MQYISTRGRTEPMGFQDAVLTGLAPDGGLLIPERIPDVRDRLEAWADLSFVDLAVEIFGLYTDLPEDELRPLIQESYAGFRDTQVAPSVAVGDLHILELFHGPTLAFKDVALQVLSRLFDRILTERGATMNLLVATSGDTGSAAIEGVRGLERLRIFVMHPKGRVAPLQERQMTTVLEPNVFNLAMEGTFDDCQRLMKTLFEDLSFKAEFQLGAVNSVNWARVLAQIVYYFYSGLQVMRKTGMSAVRFAVPTGNFGNILAGYYARQMGLPVSKLVLATNENDILSRVFCSGVYERGAVKPTLSPSMDIQVASNFERYLYYAAGENSQTVCSWMKTFTQTGRMELPQDGSGTLDALFAAGAGTRADTLEVIGRYWRDDRYVLDPHSALGVKVAEGWLHPKEPMISLATAHPAKFPDAIRMATGRDDLAHHPLLDAVMDAPARCEDLPAEEKALRDYIRRSVKTH